MLITVEPIFRNSFFIALLIELSLLEVWVVYSRSHISSPLPHPLSAPLTSTLPLPPELEITYLPTPWLSQPQNPSPSLTLQGRPSLKKETALIADPQAASTPQATDQEVDQEVDHQTQLGTTLNLPLDHGPILRYSPAPVIPKHLQDQELQASVLLQFFIRTTGDFSVQLLQSSGWEQLDALAIQTVRSWVFQPARQKGKPIPAQIQLRIIFEVE